jgi:predicted nucleotidyltransferase
VESTGTYDFGMWLLAQERERRRRHDAARADETRAALRTSLARHVPGTPVRVYGSLVKPGRFREWSDVDVAVESLPAGMTLEYLHSLLSADIGREVDVCLLERTRLRPVIEREGERWIA